MARPGAEIGLLFYAATAFSDFTLRLQFRLDLRGDNSAVFVRFRDPRQPPPAGINDPRIAANAAWLAVDTGFEIRSMKPLGPIRRTSIGQGRSTISM